MKADKVQMHKVTRFVSAKPIQWYTVFFEAGICGDVQQMRVAKGGSPCMVCSLSSRWDLGGPTCPPYYCGFGLGIAGIPGWVEMTNNTSSFVQTCVTQVRNDGLDTGYCTGPKHDFRWKVV
jgi:hypothetical protein